MEAGPQIAWLSARMASCHRGDRRAEQHLESPMTALEKRHPLAVRWFHWRVATPDGRYYVGLDTLDAFRYRLIRDAA
jgi:hypothetical protein